MSPTPTCRALGRICPPFSSRGLIAQRFELILHLGDFRSLAVADMFRRIARFDAVAGNNDVLRMQVRLVYQIGKACS